MMRLQATIHAVMLQEPVLVNPYKNPQTWSLRKGLESYPYNQKNVIKTLCSHNKDVFLDTLRRIIKEKRFEADYERVNLGVKIKCNGESILHRVLKYKDSVTLEFVKKFAGGKT